MKLLIAVACLCLYCPRVQAQTKTPSTEPREGRIVHEGNESPTATVFTYGRRPLQEAIRLVNEEYGWGINYEDGPTVNASEVVDDDSEFRRLHPGYQEGFVAKGQPFRSTFNENPTHHADEETVIQQLLDDYNASTNPGRYSLARTAQNGYAIVGTKYKSVSGAEVAFTSFLNCQISVAISPMSLHDAVQLVAKQVSDACKTYLNVEYAGEALGPLAEGNVAGNYDREPARDVVEALLLQERGLLCYSVEYVPVLNQFYLETWLVRRKITGVDGNQILDPVLNESVVGADQHFF